MKDMKLARSLSRAFPQTPASFLGRVDAALDALETSGAGGAKKPRRKRLRAAAVAAAALLVLVAGCGCVFAVRPALAADIPVVGDIVCALSPAVTPDTQTRERIADTAQRVLDGFFSGSLETIGQQFKSGGDWVLGDDTLLAAYYLQYEGATLALLGGGEIPAVSGIRVTNVEATQKAFRYTAEVRYDLTLDGGTEKTETAHMTLEDAGEGMAVVAMSLNGADFEAYRARIAEYQTADGGALAEEIVHWNAYLIAEAIAEHEAQEAAQEHGDVLTEEERIEDIAAELRYQYYLAEMTCEAPDLSALMERNEDTELYFLALDLHIRMAQGRMLTPPPSVERGYADILTLERDGSRIEATVYVKTLVNGSVGETIGLTLKPVDGGYIVIGYENRDKDGIDASLAVMAEGYMAEGCTRMEAYDKAYREVLERVEWISAAIRGYMAQGLSRNDASSQALMDWFDAHSPE